MIYLLYLNNFNNLIFFQEKLKCAILKKIGECMASHIGSLRNQIFDYVSKKYNSKIEYLWEKYPNFAIFRNNKNKKWYGIVMNVSFKKLGVQSDEMVDILNVKVDDLMFREAILQQEGFFKGYHMSKNWISILLDGTVNTNQIFGLIDQSYLVIDNPKTSKRIK